MIFFFLRRNPWKNKREIREVDVEAWRG